MTTQTQLAQIEAQILKYLEKFECPSGISSIAKSTGLTEGGCMTGLLRLQGLQFVERHFGEGWTLTEAGRIVAHMSGEAEAPGELRASVCAHGEPPAVATMCLNEDELDEWWEDLDVECKAEAFLGFYLGSSSHVSFERETRIPLAGTVAAGSVHMGARAVPQADGFSSGTMIDELRLSGRERASRRADAL
jgi:hypothetical protein